MILLLIFVLTGQVATFDGTLGTPSKIAFSASGGLIGILRPGDSLPTYWEHRGPDLDEPDWSPDGASIAFTSRDTQFGPQTIWIADEHGGNRLQISDSEKYDESPSWSPDGKYVVYYRQFDGRFAYDTKTGETHHISDDWLHVWSPDGKRVLVLKFNEDYREDYEDWKMGENQPHDAWVLTAEMEPIVRLTIDAWYSRGYWEDNETVLLAQIVEAHGHSTDNVYYRYSLPSRQRSKVTPDMYAAPSVHSPDGRFIFSAEEVGPGVIIKVTGEDYDWTVHEEAYGYRHAWSQSGKWLYFEAMSTKPKHVQADTQQLWRADIMERTIEQISEQPDMYCYFHYYESRGVVLGTTGGGQLFLTNDRHRLLELAHVKKMYSADCYWLSEPVRK